MSDNPPVHPSLGEVAEEGVELIRDTGVNPSRTVPSRQPIEPPPAGEDKAKEENAA
jgi:hypothetical protein